MDGLVVNHSDIGRICTRQEKARDLDFIEALYLRSRDYEIQLSGIPEQAAFSFFAQQFQLQQQHFRSHVPNLSRFIVESSKERIGRLYTELIESEAELHIVDITLQRHYRNKGLGSLLIAKIQEYAKQNDLLISLNIHQLNPALKWYLRMGFEKIGDLGEHIKMHYKD